MDVYGHISQRGPGVEPLIIRSRDEAPPPWSWKRFGNHVQNFRLNISCFKIFCHVNMLHLFVAFCFKDECGRIGHCVWLEWGHGRIAPPPLPGSATELRYWMKPTDLATSLFAVHLQRVDWSHHCSTVAVTFQIHQFVSKVLSTLSVS